MYAPSNMGSCAERYGVMTSDTQKHTHTNKAPRAGVQLVVNTSIYKVLSYLTVGVPTRRHLQGSVESPSEGAS